MLGVKLREMAMLELEVPLEPEIRAFVVDCTMMPLSATAVPLELMIWFQEPEYM